MCESNPQTACRALAGSNFNNFTVHDYCRYVDDLRLVISVDENPDSGTLHAIKQTIVTMLGLLLPQGGNLKFNHKKTKLICLSGEDSDISSQMSRLQAITSGPMDLDSLINVENSLDSHFLRDRTMGSNGYIRTIETGSLKISPAFGDEGKKQYAYRLRVVSTNDFLIAAERYTTGTWPLLPLAPHNSDDRYVFLNGRLPGTLFPLTAYLWSQVGDNQERTIKLFSKLDQQPDRI